MDGQGSAYFDPKASDLIFCEQDVSRMSPEPDMAYSYPLFIGHETADITITKDADLAERDSPSQPDANQSSKSESNTKTNANPSHPFMFNNIEDGFRYPCYGEGCNKTFARKEHATRHYRTKHEKTTCQIKTEE
ncbi:hypothetical protein FPRO05_10764 [Fusarium proliferatum]|uniref:C2H2-type domain-containing protein n=1 Tax=Gibberella intermedia TaxID=948311 RepID=A0A365NCF4_GIBIN|nr:hypothetical protein FPRO05_10764 [Fusarium proliferatum]